MGDAQFLSHVLYLSGMLKCQSCFTDSIQISTCSLHVNMPCVQRLNSKLLSGLVDQGAVVLVLLLSLSEASPLGVQGLSHVASLHIKGMPFFLQL